MQLISLALSCAAASAGSIIAAKTGIISRNTPDTMVPASAKPPPPSLPPLFFTLTMATIPQIKPASAVMPQLNIPKIPSTSEVTARALVFGSVAGAEVGMGGGGDAELLSAAANSGISESDFHSVAPSTFTRVCAFTRLSAIHWRNCSAVTGPYSF